MVGREIFEMKLVMVYHELLELVRSVCFKYTERMKWTELDVQGTGKKATSILQVASMVRFLRETALNGMCLNRSNKWTD
jgi:hypothetical protein